MPLRIRIAKASQVARGRASTGYLPLSRETQAAVPSLKLPGSSCSQLAELPGRTGGTGPLLSLSPRHIASGIWSHVSKSGLVKSNPVPASTCFATSLWVMTNFATKIYVSSCLRALDFPSLV